MNKMTTPVATQELADLVELMARLRTDCPWDKKQTNLSLIPYAIEETYELVDAIYSGDTEDIKGELGDVLLQVVFHAQLYSEQGKFDLKDVIFGLQEKLIRRHPHVFDKETLKTEADVKKRWEQIKAIENAQKTNQGKKRRILDVKSGTALTQACDMQTQASKVGFDWDNIQDVWDKFCEETHELKALLDNYQDDKDHKDRLLDELGDCFFALVNVARFLNIDSETAVMHANAKFKRRFGYIEDALAEMDKTFLQSTPYEMNELWNVAKSLEK